MHENAKGKELRLVPRFLFLYTAAAAVCGCGERTERLEWTSMSTVAAVQLRGKTASDETAAFAARDSVRRAFAEVESRLNRFDPDSELSRLAPLGENEILERCDAGMRPCYEAAFAVMRGSGGAFNPRWMGEGTLDLGGIAKGFAVDLAAGALAPGCDALVDLGGNLKASPGGGEWRAGVMNPRGPGFCANVVIRPGEALSTSAEYFRGRHIYDGRSGEPARAHVASATVLCRSAMLADALSTAVFILGPEDGFRLLERMDCGASAFVVMDDGAVFESGDRFKKP